MLSPVVRKVSHDTPCGSRVQLFSDRAQQQVVLPSSSTGAAASFNRLVRLGVREIFLELAREVILDREVGKAVALRQGSKALQADRRQLQPPAVLFDQREMLQPP